MADELAGPLAYATGWWWALAALTALPFALAVARRLPAWAERWVNRPRRGSVLRAQCLSAIAGIERSHAAGDLTAREAHTELSRALREFAGRVGQPGADTMTLAELERAGTGESLLDAVRAFYDGAFDARPTSAVSESARIARQVVTGWN